MRVQILVQGLRVLGVAGEGVYSVESAIVLVVPAGAEVVLLHIRIEVLTGVEQIRGRGAARSGIAAKYRTLQSS